MSRRVAATALVVAAVALGLPAGAVSTGTAARTVLMQAPDGRWLATIPLSGGGQVRVPLPPLPDGRRYDPAKISARRLPAASSRPPAAASSSAPGSAASPAQIGPIAAGGTLDATSYPATPPRAPGTVVTVAGGSCDGYAGPDATISPTRVDFGSDGRLLWTDDGMSHGPDPVINSYYFGLTQEMIGHDEASQTVRTLDSAGRVHTLTSQYAPAEGRNWRDLGVQMTGGSFFDGISDGHGGTLLNIDLPDGIYTSQTEGANVRDLPASNGIVDVDAHGVRRLVVGGRPLSATTVSTQSTDYGDGAKATDTILGTIESFTTDPNGNIYLADSDDAGNGAAAGSVRIRFVNRGSRPVTFYSGTPFATVIQPGTIGTIAGPGSAWLGTNAVGLNPRTLVDGAPSGNGLPAKLATFASVPKLVVRGNVLYLLDQFHAFADGFDRRSNLEIRAINLGLQQPGALLVAATPIAVGVIDRVAGDDTTNWGYAGDGGPARNAKFNVEDEVGPTGDFAVDREGDIYISDSNNNRIRRVDATTGVILTVAGNGLTGVSPAGAPAVLTSLNEPFGITIDNHDRPIFSEYLGKVIRRLDTTSLTSLATARLTTLAGRGPTPCGDGHLAAGRTVQAGAMFGQIYDLATDSRGDTFVADGEYETVRRISPAGRIDEVIGLAVPCASPLRSPQPQCPDSGPQSIDPGPLSAAQLANPNYVLVDRYQNLFISDVDRVRYVNFGSKPVVVLGATVAPHTIATIQTFPGRRVAVSLGGEANVTFDEPIGGLALDGQGQLYVADPMLDVIYRISRCGQSQIVAGNGDAPATDGQGDGGPALAASLIPQALLWDAARNVLLVSTDPSLPVGGHVGVPFVGVSVLSGAQAPQGSPRIRAINFTDQSLPVLGRVIAAGTIDTVVGAGQCVQFQCSYGDGGSAYRAVISSASAMALGPGERLYLVDAADNRIRVVLPNGEIAGLSSPWSEVPNCNGCNHSVQSPDGYLGDGGRALDAWFDFRLSWQAGEERGALGAIAVTPNGDLLVGDHTGRIRKIVDPLHAPLRLSATVPGVAGAGAGVTTTLPLYEDAPSAASSGGYALPQILSIGGVQYVVAARGAGRGCDVWRITTTRSGSSDVSYLGQPMTGSGGLGVGGSSCHVATANGTMAVASPVRTDDAGSPQAGGTELGIAVAASADGGSTWQPGVAGLSPLRQGTALGRLALGVDRGAFKLAYRTSSGAAVVASSTDARIFGPAGESAVGQGTEMLGDVSAGPKGTLLLAYVTGGGSLLEPRQNVAVARRDPSGNWTQTTIAGEPDRTGSLRLSPPSLALDGGGTAYLTWSDDHAVYLSHSGDGLHWTAPLRITHQAAVLPSVVAGPAGHVVVGYYVAPAGRTVSADDPYAEWSVGLTRSADADRARPHFAVRLASSGAVHYGAMCLAYDTCSESDPSSPGVLTAAPAPPPAYGTGPVRLAVGSDGRIVATFAVDADLQGNTSSVPIVGYLRDCADRLSPATASPCRTQQPIPTRPPNGVPSVAPPVLPQLPFQACAPLPPPVQHSRHPGPAPQPGHPRPATHPAPARHHDLPLAVVPPVIVEPPLEPALPPGQAPAQANQMSQATQPGSAPQSGTQPGIAAAEELEAQKARSYAYADRRRTPALPLPVVWWIAASGFTLVGYSARRRRRSAPARCRVDVARPTIHPYR